MESIAELEDIIQCDLLPPIIDVVIVSLNRLESHRPKSIHNL